VARGLLHDLLLTGDRRAVDAAMRDFVDLALSGRSQLGRTDGTSDPDLMQG
jgi:Arc/MetJ family transcription regulator